MPSRSRRSSVLALLLLAACAGGGGGGSTGSLSVLPRTATVTAGAGTVTFTATVSGDASTAVWTVAGGGSVSPAMGLTTVYTPPERVDVDTTVSVTAQANELTDTVTVTVKPAPPADVAGRVIRTSGRPVEGATVTIPGAGTATTAADGSFTIPGVRVPYDLAVRWNTGLYDGPLPRFLLYQGLRRRDPTAMYNLGASEEPASAIRLSGQITPGSDATHPVRVAMGSADVDSLAAAQHPGSCWSAADGLGAYGLSCPVTASETDVDLVALRWEADAGGLPQSYTGLGRLTVGRIAHDASLNGQHLTLGAAPATVHVAGQVTGGSQTRLRLDARFGSAIVPIARDATAPASFRYATPATADSLQLTLTQGWDSDFILDDYNLGTYRGGVAPDATDLSIPVVAPPNPSRPPCDTTLGPTDTIFEWQAMGVPRPVYVARLGGGLSPDRFDVSVITTRSSIGLDDLPDLGITVPRGAPFSWSVFGTSAASTVDEAAGPEGYLVRTQSYEWGRSVNCAFRTPN